MSAEQNAMVGDGFDSVADALRAMIGTPWVVSDDDVTRRYTVDWTGRRGPHRALVARPADATEVAAVLAICADQRVPVVPQGGNTGLVEGSVPAGAGWVVLSTERLTTIESFDDRAGQITVGAGVTLAALGDALAGSGWRFAIDLAARDTATIGGIVATNAGGLGVFRHGSTRAQLLGVQAALTTGVVVDQRRRVDKDNTGYDLSSLLCGSEGTLAVVTSARLRLIPTRSHRLTALVGYRDVPHALRSAWQLRRALRDADVIELIGPGCLELVADHDGTTPPWPTELGSPPNTRPGGGGCALFVETCGDVAEVLADQTAAAVAATEPVWDSMADSATGRARLARFREGLTDVLAPADPLKLDVSVPADSMADFVDHVADEVHAVNSAASAYVFGHVCDHNLHVNVVGLDRDAQRAPVEHRLLRRVIELDGSISAEHGIGRRRSAQVAWVRTPAELALFEALKRAWDPAGVLNPGVFVVGPGPTDSSNR